MKITLAQLNPTIGDFDGNSRKIIDAIEKGKKEGSDLIVFSELTLSGYLPEDFILHDDFLIAAEKALCAIIPHTKGTAAVIGLPRKNPLPQEKSVLNSAAIVIDGKLAGYQNKMLLPTYDVFDEKRYFEPGESFPLYRIDGKNVVFTICEDLWQHAKKAVYTDYAKDPVELIRPLNPDILINLSASPFNNNKYPIRLEVLQKAALSLNCPAILVNQVGGNDSLLFDGLSLAVNEKGELSERLPAFEEAVVTIDSFKAKSYPPRDPIADIHDALVMGLRDYFHKSGFKKACLGLSGGIDSAVVAVLAKEALGAENVLALFMPSRFTSETSRKDAYDLAKNLSIEIKEISIESPFQSYLDLLEPHFAPRPQNITEENLQARIRGMILMAFSNKFGHIVLSTGNKSELAMGYTTLYGDLAGGLAVIGDCSKDKIYALAHYINRTSPLIPPSTLTRAPSAELRPNQKDADSLPPYPLIDAVIEAYVETHASPDAIASSLNIPLQTVQEIIHKIHQAEYKRRQAPPSLRVSSKSFSIGRRYPIVQRFIS